MKVANKIFSIGGSQGKNYLTTVSLYNISTDKWIGGLPQRIKARNQASACYLGGVVYVFAGFNDSGYFGKSYRNTIEKISESALIPNSEVGWQKI